MRVCLPTAICYLLTCCGLFANGEYFDERRWYGVLHQIQNTAIEQKISPRTINRVIQESSFVPAIIRRDKNQAEFTTTLSQYLERANNQSRITKGRETALKYPTLLKKTEEKFGVPKNVIMAFWGMESDYGAFKSQYKLSDSFLTLIYDGRRGTFFTNQLIALMKLADKNNLDVREIEGSWAGAMGHFQFIPTTLTQYGVDGSGDGKIDVINSVGDAMASAGNYLKKLGWNKNDRILRRVTLPKGFNMNLCNGTTKLRLAEWRNRGVAGIPNISKTAGMICDESTFPIGYLAYENFYRIKRWNNSNSYAVAVALLADEML